MASVSPERHRKRSSGHSGSPDRKSRSSRSHTRHNRSPSPCRSRRSVSSRDRSSDRKRRRRSVSEERSKYRKSEDKEERRGYSSRKERRHRHRSPSSSSSSDDEYERKKRVHKKHKKDKKKSKKKSKKSKMKSVGEEWGKYGIIHEADIFTKESEFQAWLIEVKNADVETLNNIKRKEMFVDFMEDYNTATMPHDKFYDISKWEERQRSMRMGITTNFSEGNFDFGNDEEKLRMQHKHAARMAASSQPVYQLSNEQLAELSRVSRERVEADRMRKMGLKPRENMGLRYDDEA